MIKDKQEVFKQFMIAMEKCEIEVPPFLQEIRVHLDGVDVISIVTSDGTIDGIVLNKFRSGVEHEIKKWFFNPVEKPIEIEVEKKE